MGCGSGLLRTVIPFDRPCWHNMDPATSMLTRDMGDSAPSNPEACCALASQLQRRPRSKGVRAIGASASRFQGIRVDRRTVASDVQLSCRIHHLLDAEYPSRRAVGLFCGSHHHKKF